MNLECPHCGTLEADWTIGLRISKEDIPEQEPLFLVTAFLSQGDFVSLMSFFSAVLLAISGRGPCPRVIPKRHWSKAAAFWTIPTRFERPAEVAYHRRN